MWMCLFHGAYPNPEPLESNQLCHFRTEPGIFGFSLFGCTAQLYEIMIEGSLEAKLPTICKDGNGTARKKLGRGES